MAAQIQDRFELIEPIAQGPRGVTWRAVDRGAARLLWGWEREVTVKRLALGAALRGWEDLQLRTGLVGHPNLASVIAAGYDEEERPFLVTRHNAQLSSLGWLSRYGEPGLPLREAVALTVLVCDALARCHRLGILHLNLKPGNLLITEDHLGVAPILTDFGLQPAAEAVDWAAPELLLSGGLDRGTVRSDVYGVGLLLMALVSGRNPIGGPLDQAITREQRLAMGSSFAEAVSLQARTLPATVRDVVVAAVHANPARRHRDLNELKHQLRMGLYESSGLSADEGGAAEQGRWASVPGARAGIDLRDAVIEDIEHITEGREVVRTHLRHRDEQGRWATSGAFAFRAGPGGHSALFSSLRLAWRGAGVHLYDATVVPRGGASFYTDNDRTLAVLEPYFPITVTPIVSAEGCGSRHLTDLRDRGGSNRNLVVGKMIHAMLEAMVVPPTPDRDDKERRGVGHDARLALPPEAQFEDLYAEVLIDSRLQLLAAGLRDADLPGVRDQARKHFLNLAALAVKDGLNPFAGAFTEVTRYSSAYGMEGRIDLAFDDGHVFRILELKTGNAWSDHSRQVHCYGLLWENVAQSLGRKVHGELLYSRSGRVQPVDPGDRLTKRRVLETRNTLVSLHRHLAFGDTPYRPPHYLEDPDACWSAACKFRRHRCEFQNRVLGSGPWGLAERLLDAESPWLGVEVELVELARAYYRRFVRYVEAEHWVDNAHMGQILRTEALPERLSNMAAVGGLELTSVNVRLGRVTFRGQGLQFLSTGQEIIAHRGDLQTGHILRGHVWGVVSDMVTVSSSAAAATQGLPRDGWIIELPPARIGHRNAHQALFDLMRCRDVARLDLLLRRRAAPAPADLLDALDDPDLRADLDRLNPSQRQAVAGALLELPAWLIQGPPGTGKTTVIAEIIIQLVKRGQRVLLAAGTNTAVDNVLSRLVERGFDRFLRLGTDEVSEDLVWTMRRHHRDPAPFFAQNLAAQTESLDALDAAIAAVPVIAGTTFRALSSPVIELLERQRGHNRTEHQDLPALFDVAILDEASQITEPMALGAINRARRFILVGDHQQLPPVVTADGALSAYLEAAQALTDAPADPDALPEHRLADRALLEQAGVRGLDQSLFERLAPYAPGTRLTTQYRMNHAIAGMSSHAFYDGQLSADEAVRDLKLPVDLTALAASRRPFDEILDPEHPLVLVDVIGREHGRQNRGEAAVVLDILQCLLRPGLLIGRGGARPFVPERATAELGVISPFRAQVHLLRRLLRDDLGDEARGIQVDTVERFQGGEREIIVVSFVASGRASAHLADHRRLNVTLTRARSKLIVVGNLDTLAGTSLLYQHLIERPDAHIVRLGKR